jgi:hypothetical protein
MALSPAERVRLGLDEAPPHVEDPEFSTPPIPFGGAATPRPAPNLRLVLKENTSATAPRIRSMVQELLALNVDNANYWLQQVAAANPKQGLELYIEMMQFSLPKLKAVAVQVDDKSDTPRALTMAQLQAALVSDQ